MKEITAKRGEIEVRIITTFFELSGIVFLLIASIGAYLSI